MHNNAQHRWLGFGYVVTIFISAFLLFQVQPLISKYILPWFGGTPSVWTTCMLFFQVTLFAGYAYAHLTTVRLSQNVQAGLHVALIIAALALLPIIPDAAWKPTGREQPTLRIVLLLAASVGLPFFVLSSTGPLLQGWFSRTHRGTSPYRLYALSNVGSLLALISYPFVFEPAFATRLQATIWSWGFGVFAIGCTLCALGMWKFATSPADQLPAEGDARKTTDGTRRTALTGNDLVDTRVSPGTRVLWFCLPMAASEMLLATTNQMCMDVASVPFLWVLPLTLYLLSFILCFDSDRWYSRSMFSLAMVVMMGCACYLMHVGIDADIKVQILAFSALLFFCAMFCHGELVKLKPHPRHLTSFYLFISAGGAAGGLFVGLVSPYLFREFYELPLGMIGCFVLMLSVFWRDPNWKNYRVPLLGWWSAMILLLIGTLAVYWRNSNWESYRVPLLWEWSALILVFIGMLAVFWRDSNWGRYRMPLLGGWSAMIFLLIGTLRVFWRDSDWERFRVPFLWGWSALILLLIGMLTVFWRDSNWKRYRLSPLWGWSSLVLLLIGLTTALGWLLLDERKDLIFVSRNFYGVLRVTEDADSRSLTHGRTHHGMQFVDKQDRLEPTTYYGRVSGMGQILENRAPGKPKRVGLVGLGVGTTVTYAKPGDVYRIYEINKDVRDIAETYFWYLRDCEGDIEFAMGDARLSMEREEPQRFDVLVLDAFSSDAIPIHLLTVEAFEIYQKHIVDDGVLAVHISNRHFDLRPVVDALADRFEWVSVQVVSKGEDDNVDDDEDVPPGVSGCDWILLSRNPESLAVGFIPYVAKDPSDRRILWTDDRNNLFEVRLDRRSLFKMLKDMLMDEEEEEEQDEAESQDEEEEEGGGDK